MGLMRLNLLFLLLFVGGPADAMEIRTDWIAMPDGIRLSVDPVEWTFQEP